MAAARTARLVCAGAVSGWRKPFHTATKHNAMSCAARKAHEWTGPQQESVARCRSWAHQCDVVGSGAGKPLRAWCLRARSHLIVGVLLLVALPSCSSVSGGSLHTRGALGLRGLRGGEAESDASSEFELEKLGANMSWRKLLRYMVRLCPSGCQIRRCAAQPGA
jgi:hypothetical protein